MKYIIKFVLLLFLFFGKNVNGQTLAFPEAEGGGRLATEGRGGKVFIVTNLNDDGKGSLRWALKQDTARIIVFAVSGYIDLKKPLEIKKGNVTIAGQTAPGDGICLRNFGLKINADNVILRYIRVRPGDKVEGEHDALTVRNSENIMIDHCSFSWGNDETATAYGNKNFNDAMVYDKRESQ
ncbi:MAG: hypothetical protein LIO65_08395 [Odoribacter sp.]|nr:hypothetical protein [Odoribacter sp.]